MSTDFESVSSTPRGGRLPWVLVALLTLTLLGIVLTPSRKRIEPDVSQNEVVDSNTQTPATKTTTQDQNSTTAISPATGNRPKMTEAEAAAALLPKPLPLPPGTILPLALDPKSNQGIVLGPSVGSLAKLPKPRPLPYDFAAWQKLPPEQAIMTPQTAEEAAWMDLREFPTEQEVAELPPIENVDSAKMDAIKNLRELAVRVVMICQKNNEKLCKSETMRLVHFGHPFGTRLWMLQILKEREHSFENWLLRAGLIGQMLGDNYRPPLELYQVSDSQPYFSIASAMDKGPVAAYFVQNTIARTREINGLPPLQIVRVPPNRFTNAR